MVFPLNKKILINSSNTEFLKSYREYTEIPILNHPGSFAYKRKNHIHEGVDLYCEEGDDVYSILDGEIIGIFPFTGVIANSPWWNDTYSVLVRHNHFVINYGEITPSNNIKVGDKINEGNIVGNVKRVLKADKGRPMTMLHLEMYSLETNSPIAEWPLNQGKPENLLDPTDFLMSKLLKT